MGGWAGANWARVGGVNGLIVQEVGEREAGVVDN